MHVASEAQALSVESGSGQPHWYAAFTLTRHEKSVSQHLTKRGIDNFLPLYKATHKWSHYRKVAVDLPLFPNYVFLHIRPEERIRALEVSGLVALVGRGRTPEPLSEFEMDSLRNACGSRQLEPHPYLSAGMKARIMAGPLAGMEGVIMRTKNGGLRVVLTLDLIKQSVAVEVAADELEPERLHLPA